MSNRAIFEKQYARLVGTFATGDLMPVLDLFARPVTIYHEKQLIEPMTGDFIAMQTRRFADVLKGMGAIDFKGEIVEAHEKDASIRVKVDRYALFATEWKRFITIEYFCRMQGDTFQIEMLVVTNVDQHLMLHMKAGAQHQETTDD